MSKKTFLPYFSLIGIMAAVFLFSQCSKEDKQGCDPDVYEPNNTLGQAFLLPTVEENTATFYARISSKDDLDFYSITAVEGEHLGLPNDPQYFMVQFRLVNPSGKDYDLNVYDVSGTLIGQSINQGEGDESYTAVWQGTFGFNDDETFRIEVLPHSGDWSCEEYTLTVTMSYSTDPWD